MSLKRGQLTLFGIFGFCIVGLIVAVVILYFTIQRGQVPINGDLEIDGNLLVTKNTTILNSLTVGNTSFINSLQTNSLITTRIINSLVTNPTVLIGGNLLVLGDQDIRGDNFFSGTSLFEGDSTFNEDVTIEGQMTASSAIIQGDLQTNTLQVSNISHIENLFVENDLTVNNDMIIGNDLTVNGIVTTSLINASELIVQGPPGTFTGNFSGDTLFEGNNTFNGATQFNELVHFEEGVTFQTSGGTPGILNFYEEYTHISEVDSSGGTTNIFGASLSFRMVRIGSIVTWKLTPDTTNSISFTAGFLQLATPFPERFRPPNDINFVYRIKNSSTLTTGLIIMRSNGNILVASTVAGNTFSGASGSGFFSGSITYNIVA